MVDSELAHSPTGSSNFPPIAMRNSPQSLSETGTMHAPNKFVRFERRLWPVPESQPSFPYDEDFLRLS